METKNTILIIIATVLVMIAAEAGVYYFIKYGSSRPVLPLDIKESPAENKWPTFEEFEAQSKIDYPDTIIGRISFRDKGIIYKTTVETGEGAEYALFPDQPKSVYEGFGVKNGDNVQIQGKILDSKNLTWLKMDTIQK